MSTNRGLREEALEEFKVTRQTATGNGSLYCAMTGLDGEPLPGWFVRNELGYDGPVGYRLHEMVPQPGLEARHRRMQSLPDVPPPSAAPATPKATRETKHSRKARLEQLEIRALAMWQVL